MSTTNNEQAAGNEMLPDTANKTASKAFVTPDYPTVPVDHAIDCTRAWRNFNREVQEEFQLPPEYLDEYIRAFFIPASDIEAIHNMIVNNDQVTGCRVYLGIDSNGNGGSPVGSDLKLFIVGVQGKTPPGAPGTGTDLVYAPDTGKSMVYDFTCPCPSTCELTSVLYADQEGAAK